MWKIKSDSDTKRIYANDTTGSVCTQTMCYTDKDGNKWWQFDDLLSLPYTRSFAATKISSLYALGLSKDDLFGFINNVKSLSKSNDAEKYEKIYAATLDFESKASTATDAIKQMSSLTCVYYTINDEAIDGFDNNLQIKKMSILEADIDAHCFFLDKQIKVTESYMKSLEVLTKIALPTEIKQ